MYTPEALRTLNLLNFILLPLLYHKYIFSTAHKVCSVLLHLIINIIQILERLYVLYEPINLWPILPRERVIWAIIGLFEICKYLLKYVWNPKVLYRLILVHKWTNKNKPDNLFLFKQLSRKSRISKNGPYYSSYP